MTLTKSETSGAVMSLARLETRAASSRGAECACRLLPAPRSDDRRQRQCSRVTTSLGRGPWQPFTFPGAPHILTSRFPRHFLSQGLG